MAIAQQVPALLRLFEWDTLEKIIIPVLFKYCNDGVAAVRLKAAEQVALLVDKCSREDKPAMLTLSLSYVKGFATSTKYYQRQTFLLICQNLLLTQ